MLVKVLKELKDEKQRKKLKEVEKRKEEEGKTVIGVLTFFRERVRDSVGAGLFS